MKQPKKLNEPSTKTIMKYMGIVHTRMYRLTGGRLGRTWRIGAGMKTKPEVCLITTIGRKTGQPRTTPLIFLRDGSDIVLVASQGGRAENPLWYGNLVANPAIDIEVGRTRAAYTAHTATAEERARLWPKLLEIYADYDAYQSWTEREIPVVVCRPA